MNILSDNKKKVVIIGGGTAGLTIANQLQKYFNVVVLEKSKYRKYPFFLYKIPLLGGLLFNDSKYISKRNFELYGRDIPFFESNLLGGASVINGCVHTIGSKFLWDFVLSPFDSNYDDVLTSFDKLYSLNRNEHNKINIAKTPQNIIDKGFINVLNELKIPCGDMNYSDNEICGPILVTSGKYFRSSVLSFMNNKIFRVLTGQKVEKINFDENGKVTGVKTNLKTINADYVISSCGVIGTCDLLLRLRNEEKINQKNYLKNISLGVDIIDHTNLRIKVMTNRKFNSLNEVSHSFLKKLLILFKHFSGKSTLLKSPGATSAAYLDLDKDGAIDTKIQILQFTESGRLGSDGGKNLFDRQPGFSISITLINPESKGEITVDRSKCIVNPKYLSSKRDIELLNMALKYCLKLLRSKPISEYVLEIVDEYAIENDSEKYIVDNVYSGYHLIGGSHEAIDSNFEVRNTKGLYVCDASVFKKHVSSNTHASVVLISDIFSKFFIINNFDG